VIDRLASLACSARVSIASLRVSAETPFTKRRKKIAQLRFLLDSFLHARRESALTATYAAEGVRRIAEMRSPTEAAAKSSRCATAPQSATPGV